MDWTARRQWYSEIRLLKVQQPFWQGLTSKSNTAYGLTTFLLDAPNVIRFQFLSANKLRVFTNAEFAKEWIESRHDYSDVVQLQRVFVLHKSIMRFALC